MQYTCRYRSPLGGILLAADETGLTGLWFEGQKHFARLLEADHKEGELPALARARAWLDVYFTGREPGFAVPLHFTGSAFQNRVWEILVTVPYGRTVTYGWIAGRLAAEPGAGRVSARAAGGAVARNGIAIIVPCHRVVGADGSLAGYAGGLDRKTALLRLEGAR